jgi:hypothetical protein
MSTLQNIINTPQDSGLGDALKIAFDKVKDNFDTLNNDKIENAPQDGKQYVRENGNWVNISLEYDGNSPSTRNIENIPAGTDLTQFSLVDLIENIYSPFIAPAFTSFSISSQANPIEVGTTFSGNRTFLWNISNPQNIKSNSITIRNQSAGIDLGTNLENDGVQILNIGNIPNTSPGTTVFRIISESVKDVLFNSDLTINRIYPYFWGKLSDMNVISDFNALISTGNKFVASSTSTISITFNASNERLWFAIPFSSTPKTRWFVDNINQGDIGGVTNLFASPVLQSINTPLWNDVNYNIYFSNFLTNTNGVMQLRNN